MATTLEDVENAVAQLPQDQLRKFRSWYENFDADSWDQQIEKDISNDKLDALAETAIADHKNGRSRRL